MEAFRSSAIYILITALCFGTMEVSLQLAGSTFDPIQLTFLRFLIGGILLLPFAVQDLRRRNYHLRKSDILYLFLLGVVCVCISMSLFQIGVMQTNAGLAALVISINPVFTMVFAHFLVHESFTWRKFLVLVISVAGLVCAAGPEQLGGGNHLTGVALVLVASVAFGLYTALGKKRIAMIGGMTQNCLSFLFGCLALLIGMLAFRVPVFQGITLQSVPLLLYLGAVVTGLGYFAFLKAIEKSGAGTASIAFFIKPIIALIAAFLILHEAITIHVVVGAALVLIGFTINMLPQKAKKGANQYGKEHCTNHCGSGNKAEV